MDLINDGFIALALFNSVLLLVAVENSFLAVSAALGWIAAVIQIVRYMRLKEAVKSGESDEK